MYEKEKTAMEDARPRKQGNYTCTYVNRHVSTFRMEHKTMPWLR